MVKVRAEEDAGGGCAASNITPMSRTHVSDPPALEVPGVHVVMPSRFVRPKFRGIF